MDKHNKSNMVDRCMLCAVGTMSSTLRIKMDVHTGPFAKRLLYSLSETVTRSSRSQSLKQEPQQACRRKHLQRRLALVQRKRLTVFNVDPNKSSSGSTTKEDVFVQRMLLK